MMSDPRITDNDHGEISATLNGEEIRGWSYKDDAERRLKMQMAHEFAEGWLQCASKTSGAQAALKKLVLKGMDGHWYTSQHGHTDVTRIVNGTLTPEN